MIETGSTNLGSLIARNKEDTRTLLPVPDGPVT